jgi:uncharacterized protein (DUF305 family)
MSNSTILSYFSYLALFVGTGFISGAIVHTGNPSELGKYIVIGLVGATLFVGESFVQDFISEHKTTQVGKFFALSLLLSIGIGMISGGTQHFSDFPIYSSYLVPLGLVVSYFAFLLKNNISFNKQLLIAGTIIVLVAGAGFFGFNSYAKNLVVEKTKLTICKTSNSLFEISAKASVGHEETTCPVDNSIKMETKMENHDMAAMVVDDKNFVENMIPHHIEAINTSKIIVQSTKDAEIKQFAETVIIDQIKEVELMKNLYKTIAGSDYQNNNSYKPMMSAMNSQMGAELEKAYIAGMIEHHDGAVKMANKILIITKSNELKKLGNDIVTNQTKEIALLNGWLKTKFAQIAPTSSVISSSTKSNKAEPHGH